MKIERMILPTDRPVRISMTRPLNFTTMRYGAGEALVLWYLTDIPQDAEEAFGILVRMFTDGESVPPEYENGYVGSASRPDQYQNPIFYHLFMGEGFVV